MNSLRQNTLHFQKSNCGMNGLNGMVKKIDTLLPIIDMKYCNSTVKPLLANNIKLMFHYPKGIVSNYCYNNLFRNLSSEINQQLTSSEILLQRKRENETCCLRKIETRYRFNFLTV